MASQALTEILQHGSQSLQLKATDVLISVVQHDPVPLREFLLNDKSKRDVLGQDTTQNPLFRHLIRSGFQASSCDLRERRSSFPQARLLWTPRIEAEWLLSLKRIRVSQSANVG